MPVIFLVRHAENDFMRRKRLAGRLPGVHLNKKGRAHAQALAQRLASMPVRAVYSSPLERAMETAAPISGALGLQVIPCPALVETDYGQWQDQPIRTLARDKLWRLVQFSPSRVRFPGGESIAEIQQRICQALETLAQQYEAKDLVVCVSHADPIKLAVAYYVGMPLDLFQRLNIGPASITALHLGEASAQLLALNVDVSFTFPLP